MNIPYDNSVSVWVVISFNNSVDSNFCSCTNVKSPASFLDFLNTFTLATSPTKVFKFVSFIFANEPVNADSTVTTPSLFSNEVLYAFGPNPLTVPSELVYAESTNNSVSLNTSFTVGLKFKSSINN